MAGATAVVPATVVLREIQERGYDGGISQLKGWLAAFKRVEPKPVVRPYQAKTKGKVERFNSYLKGSFIVPLAATTEATGLRLEADVANAHVRRWLDEVANARVHATTHAVPAIRLIEERSVMLPAPALMIQPMIPHRVVMPIESLQHPLAVYDELLEVFA